VTVHTVVVDVEPPPVDGVSTVDEEEEEALTPPAWPSRMRRSDACYDISHLSTAPPPVPDSPPSASSNSSSLSAPAASPHCSNHMDTRPTEDLISEQEKALKALDAIAYDYDDEVEV